MKSRKGWTMAVACLGLRCTPDGPRELDDADFRADESKPKVIRNPEAGHMSRDTNFYEVSGHQLLRVD